MQILAYLAVSYAAQFYGQTADQIRVRNSRLSAIVIANAAEQFYSDYNRLPGRAGPDVTGTTSGENSLVKILMGRELLPSPKQNLRDTNYLEGLLPAKPRAKKRAVSPGKSDRWVEGVISEGTTYAVVDGWGNYYFVRLDSDFDGKIAPADPSAAGSKSGPLPARALVWSAGKDGNPETWEDNIKSWD